VVVQEGGYDLTSIGRLVHETLLGLEEGLRG
jgi:acetoin utilization deacetylase AcuC-like enzyme